MDNKCPKCGKKLSVFYLKENCPECGCNIMYYNMEERLEADAIKAEAEWAKAEELLNKVKAPFIKFSGKFKAKKAHKDDK